MKQALVRKQNARAFQLVLLWSKQVPHSQSASEALVEESQATSESEAVSESATSEK
ncbi:MAG: hypothetical protein ACLR70_03665 [Streptococcus thermophilus]